MADAPNDHVHVWLPANEGKELVCGDCGKRKSAVDKPEEPDHAALSGESTTR